jgi:hypothetical protein
MRFSVYTGANPSSGRRHRGSSSASDRVIP